MLSHFANADVHGSMAFSLLETVPRAEPSLREMSLSPFTERFATGLRFVTSNWRRWHSECTCSTMNSDPPTTATTTTTIARRGGAEERTRPEGRGPRCWSKRKRERERESRHSTIMLVLRLAKQTRISCGDIDIATSEVLLRIVGGAWRNDERFRYFGEMESID